MQRLSYNPLTRLTIHSGESHSLGVIGHLAIDTIIHPSFEIKRSPGGCVAAIATASVQFGIYTSIHSRVGRDFPKEWLEVLENLGVYISNPEFSDKENSLNVKFRYNENGDLKSLECNDRLLTQLKIDNMPKTECVHICPANPQDQAELIKSVKHGKRILSINFSEYFIDDYKKTDLSDLMNWKDIDIVFVNEAEARAMTNEKGPEDMASKFFDEGVDVVLITLGKKGSLVYEGKEMHSINAREVDAMDPTGCGDSYIGGFLGEYLASKDIRKAAGIGTYIASLTAQKKGSWAALLSDVGRF
ncbi:MAG: carbohydrate kinase family protein [Thermoplasmata archaeon]|nr:MAG: carbohydrate kinase family protein [Thermoplasmata archaeon]